MEACLVACVNRSLKLYLHNNALFLCERLVASFPSESNTLLLATCCLKAGQPQRSYHLLKGSKAAQNRYLLAVVCIQLDLLAEAEEALLPAGTDSGAKVPNGASGFYLLGQVCRLTDRGQAAVLYYKKALSIDPFLWCAYEELCQLGAEEEAATSLGPSADVILQEQWQYLGEGQKKDLLEMQPDDVSTPAAQVWGAEGQGVASNLTTPSPTTAQTQILPPNPGKSRSLVLDSTAMRAGSVTPGAMGHRRLINDEGKLRKVSGRLFAEPASLRRSSRIAEGTSSTRSASSNSATGITSAGAIGRPVGGSVTDRHRPGAARRSTEQGAVPTGAHVSPLDAQASRRGTDGVDKGVADGPTSSSSSSSHSQGGIASAMPHRTSARAAGSPNNSRTLAGPEDNQTMAETVPLAGPGNDGAREVLELLRLLGTAFLHLCMLRCKEAVEAFLQLPHSQYATGWVLCQVGRAHYEGAEHVQAERTFAWARRVAPHSLAFLDTYSTVLYHMKRDVELSYLAQEAVALDRLSPQAWCALGNCMSLQKEHETALSFFQRAIQLAPRFSYAHTLCGHEHVQLEQFEQGVACYRAALRLDPRHYNAWYGLAVVSLRQERFALAEHQLRRALSIHPRSTVLRCHLGMALHALQRHEEALQQLHQAQALDPRNRLPLFEHASVLLSMERLPEALEQATALQHLAPREASVYFLLGKIYKKMDEPESAMLNLSIALDLQPSGGDANLIKTTMENLDMPDTMPAVGL